MKYTFGQFELDRDRRQLFKDGEAIAINSKAFDLLCELVAAGGSVVTKERLLDAVWPDQFVEENNLTVQISALRKALGDDARMIATIPGKGYSFTARIETGEVTDEYVIESRTIERITVEEDSSLPYADQQLVGRQSRWPLYTSISIVIIAILGFAGYRYFAASSVPKITSVAVLPFVNDTADANNEYLTDGIAESVTYSLSQTPGIRVMSLSSTFRYKGSNANANTVGRELNVQAVLTGRVTQRGDLLNISAELVSATDNSILWGQQFTRKLSDIEKLQADIATSISSKMRLKLTGSKPRMTENAEAYKTYLLARYYWNKRSPENIVKSIELFKNAIALDPQFSQAYGGLAMAYGVQVANGAFTQDDIKTINATTRDAVERALQVDPDIAEAHAVRGIAKMGEWDFDASEASLRRAIELDPNFATAYQWYSELLGALGRYDEATAAIEKAYELDPFSRAVNMNVGLRDLDARRNDAAIEKFTRMIESEPDYPMAYMFLSTAYEEKGMFLEALGPQCKGVTLLKIATAEQCAKDNEQQRSAFLKDGPAGYWRVNLEVNQRLAKTGILGDVTMAASYFRVGNRDKGFEHLEKAFAERNSELAYIRVDAPFRDLVDDPRYQNLLKRIGLQK